MTRLSGSASVKSVLVAPWGIKLVLLELRDPTAHFVGIETEILPEFDVRNALNPARTGSPVDP